MDATVRVEREFAKQAAGFGDPHLTLAQAELLEWIAARLPLAPGHRVLDVAAGTGHLSRAIVPHVSFVLAVDLTAEMLRELERHASPPNVAKPAPVRALAEKLPVRGEIFDLVVSRLAFHHFEDPADVLHEMVRACKRGGTVAVIDLMAPVEAELAEVYNRYERKRDPSHTRALSEAEMTALLRNAGLVPEAPVDRQIEVSVEGWLGLTKTPPEVAADIRRGLRAELAGDGEPTGMRPFCQGDDLKFRQRWAIFVAKKPV